jgi:flagellar basal-body rod modification protein FlgD
MAITSTNPINSANNITGSQVTGAKKKQLNPEDFIKMMLTQLQHQDPMQPAKNEELLAQMSQIGQLQSSNTLQESLKSLVLQNNIGSAGNLLGKTVQGLDTDNKPIVGVVNSIKVVDNKVQLELDTGKQLPMERVTTIAPTSPTKLAA